MSSTAESGEPSGVDAGAIKVGVLLDRPTDRIDEWLLDAAAYDAAAADALWLDPGPDPDLDVGALTAALAARTSRSRLVLRPPESGAEALARALDTVRRLSRGRLGLVADPGRSDLDLASIADRYRPVPDAAGTFERLAPAERWVSVPAPQGREDWRSIRAGAAAAGASGVLVPVSGLLLDLLRNPDDPGDRRDLHLAQG